MFKAEYNRDWLKIDSENDTNFKQLPFTKIIQLLIVKVLSIQEEQFDKSSSS